METSEKTLNAIYDNSVHHVSMVTEFLSHVVASFKLLPDPALYLDEDPQKILSALKTIEAVKKMPSPELTAEINSPYITDLSENWFKIVIYQSLLGEMVLSYLFVIQEAFIKDYVYAVLTANQNILKTWDKKITYNELFNFSSMDEAVADIAQQIVDTFGHKDDAFKYLKSKFKLDLTQFKDWEKLKEATLRRDLIVHNSRNITKTYRKETGYKGERTRLKTDVTYTRNIAGIVLAFFDFFDTGIRKNQNIPARPKQKAQKKNK